MGVRLRRAVGPPLVTGLRVPDGTSEKPEKIGSNGRGIHHLPLTQNYVSPHEET